MVVDVNYTPPSKPTPEEIVSRAVAMADHDIGYQNNQIASLTEEMKKKSVAVKFQFGVASLSLAASVLAGLAAHSAWNVPVEERFDVVNINRNSAHQTCVEKVAAGHISNTESEIATCEKIFYAEEMESSATEYKMGGVAGGVVSLGFLAFAFSTARFGRKVLVEKRDLEQGLAQAEEKRLCASASRQTADAILAELNV